MKSNEQTDTYGPPSNYVSQTSGSAPSAGPASRNRGPVRMQREAWMALPLYRSELHDFVYKGRTLLYDIRSGAFFEADEVVLDIVGKVEGTTLIQLLETFRLKHSEKDVYSAVKELRDEGILSDSPLLPVTLPAPPSELEITRVDLVVTTDDCSRTDSKHRVAYLSETTGLRAVDTLLKESGRVSDLQLGFVGGEPLLNAPLVLRLIDYAQAQAAQVGKRITPIVATSRSFLNARLCAELENRGTLIRLIADQSQTDLTHIHGEGPSSLAAADLTSRNIEVHLRIEDAEETSDGLTYLETILDRYPDAHSVSIGEKHLTAVDEANLEELGDMARSRWIRGHKVRFHEIEDRIDQVSEGRIAAYHDAKGLRSVVIDTEGDIFVSHDLVGISKFKLGNCETGLDRGRQREWIRSTHIQAFDTCRNCWVRHLCAGGSRDRAYLTNGDVLSPDEASCRSQKRLYEVAIGLYTSLSQTHPEVAARRFQREQAA